VDVWLAIHPPICGNCGRPALFETNTDDWRAEAELVCPHCGAKGRAPRAIKVQADEDEKPT